MYKIIIADDEKIIQDGLVSLVDWKSLGFEIAGVFDDGAEVIEQLNSIPIDVVFTDIKMRHIGGMDIAKYIYDNEIPCKVIFISGHREFELVLQAIKYGVKDYVLKPSKVEEVSAVFSKIKKDLDESARNLEFNKKVEDRWAEMRPVLEEQFLNELVMGILHDKSDLLQRMHLLYPEIDAEYNPCMIMDLKIENYDQFILQDWKYSAEQFDEAIYNFFQIMNEHYDCHIVHKNEEKLNIFIIQKGDWENREENILPDYQVCEDLTRHFRDVFQLHVIVSSVECYQSVSSLIDQRKPTRIDRAGKKDMDSFLKEQKKLIMTNIMMGNINTAKKMLINILMSVDETDIRIKKNLVIDIFSNLSNFLQENNHGLFLIIQPYLDYHTVLNMETASQLVEYCDQIFDFMKSKEGMSDQFDKNSLVNRIKEYVDLHICEDINRENVADELFISSSQLNRILRKQIGESFLQLVTRRKMEKAVELLHDPQYKVYQVGEYLGYKTPRHFSKLFYNFSGYYPNEYRREVLKIGDGPNEEG